MNNYTFRSGMQVHAVPENDRYIDATGKKLPWAFVRADGADLPSTRDDKKDQGPFGRSTRRRGTSRSRSKTAEPVKEKDKVKLENDRANDAIFSKLRYESNQEKVDQNTATTIVKALEAKEPTEVLLYGFGEDLQWAAINFYESVSCGVILEDYEREPPGQRQDMARSYSRMAAQRSLSRNHLRKKNTFNGGIHWIKVTFDSPEAADLACARSPHLIKGHYVYAEPYRGSGPSADEPLYTTKERAYGGLERSRSLGNGLLDFSPESSETLTSETVNGFQRPYQRASMPAFPPMQERDRQASSTALSPRDDQPGMEFQHRPARIEGATRAVLLPAELALLPKQPKQSWSAWLGGNEVIGSTLPRKEDGTFDYDRASFYWRLFYWLDVTFGFDFCGLKAEE